MTNKEKIVLMVARNGASLSALYIAAKVRQHNANPTKVSQEYLEAIVQLWPKGVVAVIPK